MKKIILSFAFATLGLTAFAGGLQHNGNQSAEYVRMMSRTGSTEADAIFYNPAGMALFNDGFTISLNNQIPWQTRDISCDYAPLQMGDAKGNYEGKVFSPIFPGIYAAYKTSNWAFSLGFNPIGGGGASIFKDGLAMLEVPISTIAQMAGATAYSMDTRVEGSSIYYGFQANAAYKINDMFSVAVGVRYVDARNSYDGYMNNIQFNTGAGGAMVNANTHYAALAAQAGTVAGATQDLSLDASQHGTGWTPILGFNFHHEKLNIGVRYEFKTKIVLTNDTKKDVMSMFPDRAETRSDLPAVLSAGADYMLLPRLRLSGTFTYYFDKDADYGAARSPYVTGNTWEVGVGAEYGLTEKLFVSAGYQFTKYNVADKYESDLTQALSNHTIGFGGAYKFNDRVKLNLAGLYTKNEDRTVAQTTAITGLPTLNYNTTYGRHTIALAFGVDLTF